jgi:hypothetical protein
VVVEASLFMLLVAILRTQPSHSPLFPGAYWFIYSLFWSAIISLIAQGSATYFDPGQKLGSAKSGHAVVQAGLVLTLVLDVVIITILGIFHNRCSKAGVFKAADGGSRKMDIVIGTVYVGAILLLVRDLFTTIQIFESTKRLIWTSEALMWVFEVLPILGTFVVINVARPVKLLRESYDAGVSSSPC